jgi:Rv0078B-related antitoxin
MPQLRMEVINRAYAAILAAKTPAERVAMADSAHRTACSMIRSRLMQLHPDWTDEQRHREFLRRLLGDGANGYLAARS